MPEKNQPDKMPKERPQLNEEISRVKEEKPA